jgi:hypothetical protein
MHDMLMVSTIDLSNDAIMDAIDATGVPIVAYHADMNTVDDEMLSKGESLLLPPLCATHAASRSREIWSSIDVCGGNSEAIRITTVVHL